MIILSFLTLYAEINVHIWDVILSQQYWPFSASGRERIDRSLTKKTPALSPSKKNYTIQINIVGLSGRMNAVKLSRITQVGISDCGCWSY